MSFPQLTPSKCQHAIGHGLGTICMHRMFLKAKACFNFQPHYFGICARIFEMCVHVCVCVLENFVFEILNPYLIKHLPIPSYEIL
jgi:hypothetical protein